MLGLWWLKLYLCICVFVYLQLPIYFLDIREYLLWGPVLSRNHCWQFLIQYIRGLHAFRRSAHFWGHDNDDYHDYDHDHDHDEIENYDDNAADDKDENHAHDDDNHDHDDPDENHDDDNHDHDHH